MLITANQIAYAAHLENSRHNVAAEAETNRSNVAREGETFRHNVVTESETERSNKAREKETKRSNKATERLGKRTLKETKRHNLSTESLEARKQTESERHNRQAEQNQIDTAWLSANASIISAQISAAARVEAARLAAQTNLAIQAARDEVARLDREQREAANKRDNKTKKQIQDSINYLNDSIAAADRYQRAVENTNQKNIDRAKNDLERIRVEVDKAYKQGKIGIDAIEAFNRIMQSSGLPVIPTRNRR